MARVKSNLLLEGLQGGLGKELYVRVVNGQTIVATKPGKRQKPPGENQLARQQRFREATAWAKEQLKDPERVAAYKARCVGNQSPLSLLVGEFMRGEAGASTSIRKEE